MNIWIIVIISAIVISVVILTTILVKKYSKEKFTGPLSFANVYKNIIPQSKGLADLSQGTNPYNTLLAKVNAYQPLPDGTDADGNQIKHADEVYLKVCCQLAMRSVSLGNFGIGVVVVDPNNTLKPYLKDAVVTINGQQVSYLGFVEKMLKSFGYTNPSADIYLSKIVAIGLNQLFYSGYFGNDGKPHVRSDRHGEMVAMDLLEDAIASVPYEKDFQNRMPKGLELYTQLESCPMCMSRLASSSISAVYHGAPDNGGGMVHKLCDLPPIFIGLTSVQKFSPAFISGNIKGNKADSLIQLCLDCFGINVATVGTKQNNRAFGCPEKCPEQDYCRPTTDPAMLKRMGYDTSGFIRY